MIVYEKQYSNHSTWRRGASIVFQDIHATGYACSEELRLLYTLLNPKYLIPSHGEYRYRRAAAKFGHSIGIPRENIFLIKNGDVLEMSAELSRLINQNVRDKRLEAQIQKALEQCILDKTQQSPIVVVITTKVML